MIASLFNFFIKKIIRTEPPKQTRQPELMVFKYEGRNYAVVKSKAVGGSTNGVPDDTVQKLTMDKDGVRQMSSEWIENNLRIMVNDGEISKEAMQEIMAGLQDGATKRIYAQTDANGTTYHVIEDVMKEGKPDPKDACVSNVAWKPGDFDKPRSGPPEVEPPTLALRRKQLVPRIKHVNFRKALQERGLPEEHLPATTPLCGELLVSYAFDLPEQFVMVSPRQLKQAGIAVSEMPALALDNLARSMPEPQQSRLNGCIAINTGGDLEATLLLLDAFWEQMQASLGGEIVAVVPRRNRLLLCAGNDAQALEQLDRQARVFFAEEQDAHALSLQKMVRRNGRWQLFGAH
ncbi:hypothetical protein [Verminephrobacter eiseniae]|uniref:DUF1444 family protein n=1 Tax=Verminephrobacter eiseniae (strain EF01-2) TaxID=391735 RepID=A1WEJ5_VEREI|nr:hypothetical protein [Verminephrobacter eiseniae]ABM56052.1 hypothetical protein Veis_0261 [Verminephrobacter eiseniae EF01-2]